MSLLTLHSFLLCMSRKVKCTHATYRTASFTPTSRPEDHTALNLLSNHPAHRPMSEGLWQYSPHQLPSVIKLVQQPQRLESAIRQLYGCGDNTLHSCHRCAMKGCCHAEHVFCSDPLTNQSMNLCPVAGQCSACGGITGGSRQPPRLVLLKVLQNKK